MGKKSMKTHKATAKRFRVYKRTEETDKEACS